MNDFHQEKYRIPGTNIFNFTAYSRENIPKPPPSLKVGDKVCFCIETEITDVGRDCDGTALYGADMIGWGWAEGAFTLVGKG
jgi:hypothetical protein